MFCRKKFCLKSNNHGVKHGFTCLFSAKNLLAFWFANKFRTSDNILVAGNLNYFFFFLIQLGDTAVMVTAVSKTKPTASQFMPLVVSTNDRTSFVIISGSVSSNND